MPYKTKFREVETPRNAEELKAFPRDANSLRSLGAAQYREITKTCQPDIRCYTMAAIYAGADMFVHDILELDERREMRYVIDGSRRAARQAGDKETAERLPDMINKIKAEFPMKKD